MTSEQPEECESCHFTTPELAHFEKRWGARGEIPGKWLCALCAGTLTGNAMDYPDQYRDSADILRTICYVGNVILKAIKER